MPDLDTTLRYVPRHAESLAREALGDTRIVAIVGPRQAGKTTLVRKIAADEELNFITLDDAQSRSFANSDPTGFLRDVDRAVIDEIQRAPDLILALKQSVDEDPRPGRFLITGSVDLFRSSLSPDSLAGRVETIELLPLSQAELQRNSKPAFLRRLFNSDWSDLKDAEPASELVERVLAGGYPAALARKSSSRRRSWLRAYAESLAERDVPELADVTKTSELSKLVALAAAASGRLTNLSALAQPLGVDSKTVDRWLSLLEHMFVVRRVPAWHRNDLKRLVKTPKLHFLDSGLLAALTSMTDQTVQSDREKFGPLLEGFVFSELAKLAAQTSDSVSISHYRDRDKVEVDFVVESESRLSAVEVKAAATVRPSDFRGLKRLAESTGPVFSGGVVLYDGNRVQRAGENMFAVPISLLWSTSDYPITKRLNRNGL